MPNFPRISYENPLRIPPQKKRKPNETNHLYYNKPPPAHHPFRVYYERPQPKRRRPPVQNPLTHQDEPKGLTLYEAARRFNVPFQSEARPADRHVQANGLRFHYLEWGERNRPTLLMLHGICQQCHSWDFISLALAHKYHVIALDARGHGDTQWPPDADYSLDAHQCKTLDGVADALELRNFIVVGHSMGGRNGYVFASRRPDIVRGLVIVDTGPGQVAAGSRRIRNFISLPDRLNSYEEFVERVMEYTGRPAWLVHGSLQHTIRQMPDGKWTWKYDAAIRSPDFRPQSWPSETLWKCLKELQCPTLVVRGANTDVLSQEVFQRMQRVIPQCQSATVEKAGHLVPGDNPRGFLEALHPFLTSLTTPP